jgi:putative ATP-binding cassette transporter
MKSIYFFMRYSRRFMLLAVLTGVVSGVCSTGLLALINAALKHRGPSASSLMLAFLTLCVVGTLSRIASELLLAHLGQRALLDLRLRLCNQILGVPLRRLEEIGGHRILTALTEDVPTATNAVSAIPVLCINVAIVVGCLIYLGYLSWVTLLGMLFFLLVGIGTYQLAILKGMRDYRAARAESDNLFRHFQSLVDGIKELKLNRRRRQAFITEGVEPTALNFRRHHLSGQASYTVAASWGQLLSFVVIGLLIFLPSQFIGVSEQVLTGYTLALLFMTTPLQGIMLTAPNLGRANLALKKVEELGLQLASQPAEVEPRAASASAASWRSLEMIGVTHQYRREGQEHNFVLGPLDLQFLPGEVVFLTGGNGSGKTTFAKILAGLYAPESGEIRLDGRPVTDEERIEYRELFSTVFSDFFLFDKLLGLDGPGLDAQAQDYLAQLQLSHKVDVRQGGFSTTELSQGQRKRLALLTAFLEDRPIYLFDEWAADQDPTFKHFFYYDLLRELKSRGKTVFVISHDDRYYRVGDRLLKFENGNLISDSYEINPGPFADELALQLGS